MKFKLFLRKYFLGQSYLINMSTKEIHKIDNIKTNCHIKIITHKKYITIWRYPEYLVDGYNGCRWCNKVDDKG